MSDINLYSSKVRGRRVFPENNWLAGLSDYNKQGGAFLWARGVDYRSEPSQLTLLPQAVSEAGSNTFSDLVKWSEQVVGRTITLGSNTNIIANGSFETNTTGWTLGADFTRASDDAYLGTESIKQVSTTGSATFTTASGSGLTVNSYADYQLTFQSKVSLTSGLPATVQVLGGSLTGPNLLSAPLTLSDTALSWAQVTATFNAGQYSSVFIVITNQSGHLTAHYDAFSLNQINSIATYAYGNLGNIYKRYSNASWVTLGQIPNSHGNGMAYYGEDDYLYMTGDKTLGRLGPISSGTPTLVSDYLTSAGGIPTNTNSASLIAANSDYFAKATPSSALKITGDIALEAFIYPNSLPAVGSTMTIAGLWNENTNKRAYKLDLLGISGFFGDQSNSTLTISSDTTDAPIDSAASGTSGTNILNANNASFAAGQKILIIQMTGTGAGTKQETTIQSYDSTNHIITTQDLLNFSYNSSGSNAAQVIVGKQYSTVTINSGKTLTAKTWNNTVGGVLYFFAASLTGAGNISANGCGFAGGSSVGPVASQAGGGQGEGTGGATITSVNPNGNGGGGGFSNVNAQHSAGGGAGGGNGTIGSNGSTAPEGIGGTGGNTTGASDLSTITLGGGGGGGGAPGDNSSVGGAGSNGGGAILLNVATWNLTGTIQANGNVGNASTGTAGSGGGGAGGSILIRTQTATFGINLLSATGASGGTSPQYGNGGTGGTGRIAIAYQTSYTGTSVPALNAVQDSTLVTTTSYQIRLGISNDGTAFEYLAQTLQSLAIAKWDRISVSWAAATSTASFYENAALIGTTIGTKTAIYASSTADFTIGANVGASVYQNFFDGYINSARVWAAQQTQAQFQANNLLNLGGVATSLVGEWFYTATGNDVTSNANNLTATGSPTPGYVTTVPFPGATTRGDIDQTGGGTANTYSVPTSLTEADKLSFVPDFDPQKSIQLNIGATGAGNWTAVIHDGLNQQVALITVPNASLHTGEYEFVFPSVYRPVVGATYHAHIYSTAGSGTVKTITAATFSTAEFTTYYQFLVNDTEYHPIMQMGNSIGIGNERYLALLNAAGGDLVGRYNGQGYNSRRLVFPAGWRVRCFGTYLGYYAIGCWRGTSIKDFDQGIVFLWDGYSITYNNFFYVPEGAVNALFGENGTLYLIAGYHGDILEYTGADQAKRVKRIPKVGNSNYIEVAPGALTYYDSLLRIGVSYNSDSATLERGVYTWGTKYPDREAKSLSFDYPISTGNRGSSVSIGALMPVGGALLMYYQDGVNAGVNNINPGNPVQTTGTYESLITDFGMVWKPKDMEVVRSDHQPLGVGANVDVKYKFDYEVSWHNLGITDQAVGDQTTRLPMTAPVRDYHAMQLGIDLSASAGISPVILESSDLTDLRVSETDEHGTY